MNIFSLLMIGSFIACEDSDPPAEEKTVAVEASKQKDSSEKPKKKTAEKKTEEKKGFDPLKGVSLKEICSSNSLSLIKWPYDQLQKDFASLCCIDGALPKDDMMCEMDWPFNDVPSCDSYDYMRNEIFARYGRAFTTAKWKKTFAANAWYKIRDDFSNDWLSKEAQANVNQLISLKKNKVGCMD